MNHRHHSITLSVLLLLLSYAAALGQGSAFTYQGRLMEGASPARGLYDLRFALFDAASGPTQVGTAIVANAVAVNEGVFTVTLDFGAVFGPRPLWLEIAARTNGAVSFSPLSPRQPVTPAPRAVFATEAATAESAQTAQTAQSATSAATAAALSVALAGDKLSGVYGEPLTLNNPNNVLSGTIAGVLIGEGAGLTNLSASALSSGTLADGRLSGNVARLNANQVYTGSNFLSGPVLATNENNVFSGTVAGQFHGGGAGLSNLAASALSTGTVADNRLSANVARLNANQAYTGSNFHSGPLVASNANNTFSGTMKGVFGGDGAGLSNITASALSTGTVADNRLSANVARLNANQAYTGSNFHSGPLVASNANNAFSGRMTGVFDGDGAGLTNLNGLNLASGSVTASALAPGTVTTAALAVGAVTSDRIAPGAVSQLGTPDGAMTAAVQVNEDGWVGVGANSQRAGLQVSSGGATFLASVQAQFDIWGYIGAPSNITSIATSRDPSKMMYAMAMSSNSSVLVIPGKADGSLGSSYNYFQLGSGALSNLVGASGVAFGPNNLLAIAAPLTNAVTLITVMYEAVGWGTWRITNQATMWNGSGGFNDLAGAAAVAFSPVTDILAIAAPDNNAVTLADVSNPKAPAFRGVMKNRLYGFDHLGAPSALAFSTNLLAIAGYTSNAVTLADITSPASPQVRAVLNAGSGYPYLRRPRALAFSGRLLAIASEWDNAVTLVDAADPVSPVLRSVIRNSYAGVDAMSLPSAVSFMKRLDKTFLAVAAQQSGAITIFDVSDPAQPAVAAVLRSEQNRMHYLPLAGVKAMAFDPWGRIMASGNAENSLALLTLSDQKIGVISDGWVGIGTSQTPEAPLDVRGNVVVRDAEHIILNASHLELGYAGRASGWWSTTIGYGSEASGRNSIALGLFTDASGDTSTAMGFSTEASGYYSTAMGYSSVAAGRSSTALGQDTLASGEYSVAMGWGAKATNKAAIALGLGTSAGGVASMSAGTLARASHDGSFVWADHRYDDFSSTDTNQFLIRASRGVGINLNNPTDAALSVGGPVRLNDNSTLLRGGTDLNHGLGWFGASKLFGGQNVDGPVLYGYSGGGLGVWNELAGTNVVLSWKNNGRVGIGKTSPASALDVNGTVTATAFSGNGAGLTGLGSSSLTLDAASLSKVTGGLMTSSGTTVSFWSDHYLNDRDIFFRNDAFHGLGWYGSPRSFSGLSVNGPVIYGWDGGALGCRRDSGYETLALSWNSSGNVGIGTLSPSSKLTVIGEVRATTFSQTSDRDAKERFAPVNAREVLNKVAALPISTWTFKTDPGSRHLGPTAQDFYSAFKLGKDERHITTVDEGGVALAAIQGLNQKLVEELARRDEENAELKRRLSELERVVDVLARGNSRR